jgi:tetratricopeptide (TPR) repeat protein
MRRRLTPSLAFASCLAAATHAAADQKDPRLDPLFADLKAAPSTQEAGPIEQRIWLIWSKSGVETVDRLMAEGTARLNEGNNDAALALFDRVVKLAPEFAEGWNKRATTLYAMGKFDQSALDIDRVLALEPRHFGALSGLGLCDIRLGKEREALAAFQRAAAFDPQMPGVQARIEVLKKRLIENSI